MMQIHDLALLFPPMDSEQYEKLKTSIAEIGLLDPITTYEEKVLDGTHRQRACSDLGVIPVYEDYEGDDPLAFVIAKNRDRRHMSKEQLAILGVELLPHFEARAKQRQQNGGSTYGRGQGGKVRDKSPEPISNQEERSIASHATDEAGNTLGVSGRHIRRAKNLKEKDPDLFEEVKAGTKSLSAADKELKEKTAPKPTPKTPTSKTPTSKTPTPPTPIKPKPAVNPTNGKTNATRVREAKARRKFDSSDLSDAMAGVAQLCSILEAIDLSEIEMDALTLMDVNSMQDDLISLMIWVDRSLLQFTTWIGDTETRKKIEILRNPSGRTPEEAELCRRLADRLERKLQSKIAM